MSRIITDNYIEKLNGLIKEFEQEPYLTSFVDFFFTEVKKDQFQKVNRNQKVFSMNDIKKLTEIKGSTQLKRIFTYIKIIIELFEKQYLHIHINVDLSKSLIDNITALFAWEICTTANYDNVLLENELSNLSLKTNRELNLLDDNGHNENKLRRE